MADEKQEDPMRHDPDPPPIQTSPAIPYEADPGDANLYHQQVEAAKKERAERVMGPGVFPGDLDEMFTYHAPTTNYETAVYRRIREVAKLLALTILRNVPNSGDRTVAVRKVREAVMVANAGLALRGRF